VDVSGHPLKKLYRQVRENVGEKSMVKLTQSKENSYLWVGKGLN